MTIEKNKLVSLNYTLKNVQGEIVDSSEGAEPLDYIHGYGFLITGLEKELEGKKIGDKFSVEIEPAEAYGEKNPELIFDVPRTQFDDGVEIAEGMQFEAAAPEGSRIVTVTKVDGDNITIDANHPLAGEKLFFNVEVVNVRDVTEEEIAQLSSGGCGCGDDCGCGSDGCGSGSCGCGGCC